MNKITVHFDEATGSVLPLHAVNNGPVKALAEHTDGNFDLWKAAGFPYARNHDVSFNNEHLVDISAIFPDFDADVNDPASYDFTLTDEFNELLLEAGSQIFYRLGQRIEHPIKKYNIFPPKDYLKWAQICEHIILHYNEGWADGYHMNIQYWEIWNEADLDPDDAPDHRTWAGTEKQFHDFYEVAAKHLKNRFPHLKIGGPALAYRVEWADRFLQEMQKRQVPMDFFSWHIYANEVAHVLKRASQIHNLLEKYGYAHAESILNEWNYAKDTFAVSKQHVIAMKGGAFYAASVLAVQARRAVDMMMYYEAGPASTLNGIFNFYDYAPFKTYFAMKMFNELYKLGTSVRVDVEGESVYAAAAKDASGSTAVMLCHYLDEPDVADKTVSLSIPEGEYDMYLVDREHDMDAPLPYRAGDPIRMKNESVILLKSRT